MAKNQRRNGEQWEAIIQAQEQSGMTAKAFCEKRRLGLASFYQWRKRLNGGSLPQTRNRDFIELEPPESGSRKPSEHPVFEAVLDLGDGISMTLRRG